MDDKPEPLEREIVVSVLLDVTAKCYEDEEAIAALVRDAVSATPHVATETGGLVTIGQRVRLGEAQERRFAQGA